MSKAVPPPTYIAPTLGEEDLPELPDEFYTEELVALKCKRVQKSPLRSKIVSKVGLIFEIRD
jgi:hypothetical protein